jgi:hypothetical protein
MSTWRYTNTRTHPVKVAVPARKMGQTAALEAGIRSCYEGVGWYSMTVCDTSETEVFAQGRVDELAEPGDTP